jgi:hypothetical protein
MKATDLVYYTPAPFLLNLGIDPEVWDTVGGGGGGGGGGGYGHIIIMIFGHLSWKKNNVAGFCRWKFPV